MTAFDQLSRTDLPTGLPEHDVPKARYGQDLLYLACQLLYYRELGPKLADQALPVITESTTAASHRLELLLIAGPVG